MFPGAVLKPSGCFPKRDGQSPISGSFKGRGYEGLREGAKMFYFILSCLNFAINIFL